MLHRSYHTERQYRIWIRAYILFCNRQEPDKAKWRHPTDCGRQEVEAFLTHLAVDQRMAASTQNQALCALVKNAGRVENTHKIVTLASMDDAFIDVKTVVIIGNSQTCVKNGRMITSRGYRIGGTHPA